MANLGYIQLTRACNQDCIFCSNPANKNSISFLEIIKLVDGLIKRKYEGVVLTGGEPTLFEDLDKVIAYCVRKKFFVRMVTNAQKLSDIKYLKKLGDSGLKDLHISIYSHKEEIQNFLAKNHSSFQNIKKALNNMARLNIFKVNINIVINSYNSDHLSLAVKWVLRHYPFVRHFVFNNLDPLMNRATQNPDTIPRLIDFEIELDRAMYYLNSENRTFRVERVPLCYMASFPQYSTETRKIVKAEERIVHFLDSKKMVRQKNWFYEKADCCKYCSVDSVCAGLYQGNKFYSISHLYPLFIDPEQIKNKILGTE